MMNHKCKVCNQDNYKFLYSRKNDNILKCLVCSALFSDRFYTQVELDDLYSDNFYNLSNTSLENDYRDLEHNRNRALYKVTLDEIIKISKGMLSTNIELLDFGSGPGAFLSECKNYNISAVGIEFSAIAANYSKEKYKVDVTVGDEGFLGNLSDHSFDVITCWNVVEHLQNPNILLREFYRILKPGGLLCISTPNSGSLNHRLKGKSWYNVVNPTHVVLFNKKSLVTLLRNNEFLSPFRISFMPRFEGTNILPYFFQSVLRFSGLNSELRIYCFKN